MSKCELTATDIPGISLLWRAGPIIFFMTKGRHPPLPSPHQPQAGKDFPAAAVQSGIRAGFAEA